MPMHLLLALLTLAMADAPQTAPATTASATPTPAAQAPSTQKPTGTRPPRPDLGPRWESMFNGKDLTGWVPVGNEKWTVEDGAIHGEGITKEYGYLRTEKKYKDFQMTLRFKCEADGNSGLFFHAEFKEGPTAAIAQGLQFEIDRTLNHHTGGLYGDGRNWVVWPAPELETIIRPNDWNDFHVTVIGNRYISRLNGELLVDFTDPTPRSFDGYIALQLHSGGLGNMRFKDLYIRDLTVR